MLGEAALRTSPFGALPAAISRDPKHVLKALAA